MIDLRPYQSQATTAAWREVQERRLSPLIVIPTGGGKTEVYLAFILQWLEKHPTSRVLVLAHRNELVIQPEQRMLRRGVRYVMGVISASANRSEYGAQITFAMKDTLVNIKRLNKYLAYGVPDLIITDEAHHAVASTYGKIYDPIRALNPNVVHLGVTATPERGDGVGFGGIFTPSPYNAKSGATFYKPLSEMIAEHWLAAPKWLIVKTGVSLNGVPSSKLDYVQAKLRDTFETPAVIEMVVENHRKNADGKKAICFTVSVKGAENLAKAFEDAGYYARFIHGEMDQSERTAILNEYKTRDGMIICNCAVLTEGFDEPTIEVCHLVRPTKSIGLYVQMIGRVLRPKKGGKAEPGETAIIFEYAPEKERHLAKVGYLMELPPEEVTKMEKADQALDRQETEDGEVLAGFAFDGQQIHMAGLGIDALSIITIEVNYLADTDWRWHKDEQSEWMTMGVTSATSHKRILAISPRNANNRYDLHGFGRESTTAPWRHKLLAQDVEFAVATEQAEAICEKYGIGTLSKKQQLWHDRPISDGQLRYLRRLANKRSGFDNLNQGEASTMIDHLTAMQQLKVLGLLQD